MIVRIKPWRSPRVCSLCVRICNCALSCVHVHSKAYLRPCGPRPDKRAGMMSTTDGRFRWSDGAGTSLMVVNFIYLIQTQKSVEIIHSKPLIYSIRPTITKRRESRLLSQRRFSRSSHSQASFRRMIESQQQASESLFMRREDPTPFPIPTMRLAGATDADCHSYPIGRYSRYVFDLMPSIPASTVGSCRRVGMHQQVQTCSMQ